MRIITGKHKSRVLKTLKGPNTRPMMDRMKESVFNTIDSYIEGANVLDLFGGSGALSLEAISRGAKHSSISEINYEAYKVILENVQTLKEENNVTIYKMSYQKLLQVIKENEFKFDLVFVDPPYKLEVGNLIIEELIKSGNLNDKAIIVSHYYKGTYPVLTQENLEVLKHNVMGTSEYIIYKYINQ
ncbi:MAG: 16S rRNA (guanine(966)-N(2))-methyltransferase RsmD [Bacilli bacterium]|jgi:16S rRNA (guanine966-N2)-methyltransferase